MMPRSGLTAGGRCAWAATARQAVDVRAMQ